MVVNQDGYRLLIGDLRTGKIHVPDLPNAGLKWGLRLNNSGPMSATLRPFSDDLAPYPIRALTTLNKQFMAVAYGDTILEAGPILKRPYDEETREMTISGLGLWNIFDRRKNLPGAYLVPGAKVTEAVKYVSPRHFGSVGRELIRTSIQDNPYGGDLAIVLPATRAGSTKRTYQGYNLTWLGEDLRKLTQADDGGDMRLRPRFVPGDATRIEWVYEHGEVDILHQSGPDWSWDTSVEDSGVAGLGVDQDGSGVGSKSWVPGSGQEQSMKLASQIDTTLVDAGGPWVEVEESGGDEEDLAVLQGLADRTLADAARPWDTWSVTVRADTDPRLGSYLPGDWAVINTPRSHPILPAGIRARVRILAMDGDHSMGVKLTVAPIQTLESTTPDPVYSSALLPSPTLLPSPALLPRAY